MSKGMTRRRRPEGQTAGRAFVLSNSPQAETTTSQRRSCRKSAQSDVRRGRATVVGM